jgi:hypothetical protein
MHHYVGLAVDVFGDGCIRRMIWGDSCHESLRDRTQVSHHGSVGIAEAVSMSRHPFGVLFMRVTLVANRWQL